jgi:hypothetical protein
VLCALAVGSLYHYMHLERVGCMYTYLANFVPVGKCNPILPYPTLPYPTLPYPILSYPILSYPILSYPTPPYLQHQLHTAGMHATSTPLACTPSSHVDRHVAANASNDPIGDRIGEWHQNDGEECRDGLLWAPPIDVHDILGLSAAAARAARLRYG